MMKVGIIGCGRIARVHLSTLCALPNVEIAGLCDPYLPAAGAQAERFGLSTEHTQLHRSIDGLLEEARPDVVHVLTPPETHARIALQAFDAGCHVFVEKPLATTTADAQTMRSAAEQKGLSLCVDHNRLFDPIVEQTKQLLEQGVIGELVTIETWQGYNRGEGANTAVRSPADVYHNLAVHSVYLQRAFLGQIQEMQVVSQRTGRFPEVFAEELRVVLKGEHALGQLCFSTDIQPHMNSIHLYGTQGILLLDLNTMTLVKRLPSRLPKLIAKSWVNIGESLQLISATVQNAVAMLTGRLGLYPGISRVIRGFYDHLANGTAPLVTADDGVEVVRLMEEIQTQATQQIAQTESHNAEMALTRGAA